MLIKGATYKYHGFTGVMHEMKVIKGVATIFLQNNDSTETIKKSIDKYEEWQYEFEFIKSPDHQDYTPATAPSADLPAVKENNLINELQANLLEDIKRVRADKAYIPQAKQACNTTNTLLNLVKIQIQLNRRG